MAYVQIRRRDNSQKQKVKTRREDLHTVMIDTNFRGFTCRVHQTSSVDVVRKGSQAVVSRFDDSCVNRLVGVMTSISAS